MAGLSLSNNQSMGGGGSGGGAGAGTSAGTSRLGIWTDNKAPGSARQGANNAAGSNHSSSYLHASHSTPNLHGVCLTPPSFTLMLISVHCSCSKYPCAVLLYIILGEPTLFPHVLFLFSMWYYWFQCRHVNTLGCVTYISTFLCFTLELAPL